MNNNVILLANITALRKMGTTNFFRCLKENPGVKGTVLLGSEEQYLDFTLEDADNVANVKDLLTASNIVCSASYIKKRELRRCLPNSQAEEVNKKFADFFVTDTMYIRAETEKGDYRSQSNPTVFRCDYCTNYTHAVTPEMKVVSFTEKSGEVFENINKEVRAAVKETSERPTAVPQSKSSLDLSSDTVKSF